MIRSAKKIFHALMAICLTASFTVNANFFDDLKTDQQTSDSRVSWQAFGPGMSGYIDMFWVHEKDPNAMFNSLDMGDYQGTWNHGFSWHSMHDHDYNGGDLEGMTYVAFSHQNPDFGLALAKPGIYKTDNRGRSWSFLLDIDTTNSEKHNVLVVDPSNDNNWYIGAGQGWLIKNTHYNKDGLFYSSDSNHSEGFILKSTDKGESWTKITSTFNPLSDFSSIVVDPNNSNNVYASCQYGVYRSTDAGINWVKVTGAGLPHNMPRDMASFYDTDANKLYLYVIEVTHYTINGNTIDASGGVYRSEDGGENWTNLTGNLKIDMTQIDSWGYKDRYYNAMAKWFDISKSIADDYDLPTSTMSQFTGIEVDPTNKDRIYIVHNFKHDYAFPPGNIWMTENAGESNIADIKWIAAAREGLYWENEVNKSYWEGRGQPLGVNVQFAHVQKEHSENDDTQTGPRFIELASNGEAYTAFSQQVMRSADNGKTWRQIDDYETYPGSGHWVGSGDTNLPGQSLCVDTGRVGQYLFGSGEHGLWRNTNDGNLVYPGAIAVEQLSGQSRSEEDALSIDAIAVHPDDPNKIYTLNFRQHRRGKLAYSPDNGATWQELSTTLVFPSSNDVIRQKTLLIDPDNPDNFYFTVPRTEEVPYNRSTGIPNEAESNKGDYSFHGIYKSTIGGDESRISAEVPNVWERADSGIPDDVNIAKIVMDPANAQTLYAVITRSHDGKAGGLYKTIDGAANWTAVTAPINVNSVNDLQINKTTGHIYIACGTNSNDSDVGGVWVDRNDSNGWQLIFDNPHAIEVDSSAVDTNVIVVAIQKSSEAGNRNPGMYLTTDGAVTWHKINKDLAQPERITSMALDPYNPKIIWATLYGTGFWRADTSALYNDDFGPYTVTFNPGNFGTITSGNATQSIAIGNPATAPVISPNSGYEFVGWDKMFNAIGHDITITAKYETTLPVTSGLYKWLDAEHGVFKDGEDHVTAWQERVSGSLLHPKGTIKPTYTGRIGRTTDYRPAVRFHGDTYFDLDNAEKSNGEMTLFVAYSRDAGDTAGTYERLVSSVVDNPDTSDTGNPLNDTFTSEGGFYLSNDLTSGEIQPTIHSSHSTSSSFDRIAVGIHRKNYAQGYNGDISEVILYDRELSESERTQVEDYLKSKWITYTVTFDPGTDGEIADGLGTQTVQHGHSPSTPYVSSTTASHHQSGWHTTFDAITSDVTLTAEYSLNEYTVTFNAGSYGMISSGTPIQLIEHGSAAVEPTITPDTGYSFNGWNATFNSITSDLTVTADYIASSYTVIFDPGTKGAITGGTATQSIQHGSNAVSPEITANEYYAFAGWDQPFSMVTGPITITAQYALRPFASSDPYIWLSADAGVETDETGKVISWANLADGVQHPASNNTNGADDIKLVTDTIPVLRFANNSYFNLDNSEKTEDSPVSLFVVYSRGSGITGDNNSERIISSLESRDSNYNDTVGSGFYIAPTTTASFAPKIKTMLYSTENIDGRTLLGGDRILKELYVGTHRKNGLQGYDGDISEIILYNRLLTEDEVASVQNYLTAKWIDATGISLGDIILKEGYNLTFFPTIEDNAAPEVMLNPILSAIDFIKDIDDNMFNHDGNNWVNSGIDNIIPYKGYLIKAKSEVNLAVYGTPVTAPTSLALVEGHNIVPVIGNGVVTPLTYFDNIKDQIIYIRDERGNTMRKIDGSWVNNIGTLTSGKAYIIKTTEAVTLTIP